MAITFTLEAFGGNKIPQSDLEPDQPQKNVNLTITRLIDTENSFDQTNVNLIVGFYRFDFYFIDKPTGSAVSFDTSFGADKVVTINNIDTWGSYRIFAIAERKDVVSNVFPTTIAGVKSEENPLKAPESQFVTLSVESSNNSLEKPANFERNWKEKYDKLIDVVDSSTKRINVLKVDNNSGGVQFTLPAADGTDGQMLTTDGSGQLQFIDLDLSNMENNISLNTLTDVNVADAVEDQVLKWNGTTWIPGASSGIAGLTSNDTDVLTLADGYNILPEGADSVIGSDASPFADIKINSINGQDLTADTKKLLPEIAGTNGMFLYYNNGPAYKFVSMDNVQFLNQAITGLQDAIDTKISTEVNNLTTSVTWAEVPPEFITQTSVTQHNGALTIASMHDFDTYSKQIFKNDTSVSIIDTGASNSTHAINFTVDNLLSWKINYQGHLLPEVDENFNIGSDTNKVNEICTNGLKINDYFFPNSKGTVGQILGITNAELGQLGFVDQATDFSDLIAIGVLNPSITSDDPAPKVGMLANPQDDNTGAYTGKLSFYTNASHDATIFPVNDGYDVANIPEPVWTMSADGHLIPGKTATFNIGEAGNELGKLYLSEDKSLNIGDSLRFKVTNVGFDNLPDDNVLILENYIAGNPDSILSQKAFITTPIPADDDVGSNFYVTYQNMGPSKGFSLVTVPEDLGGGGGVEGLTSNDSDTVTVDSGYSLLLDKIIPRSDTNIVEILNSTENSPNLPVGLEIKKPAEGTAYVGVGETQSVLKTNNNPINVLKGGRLAYEGDSSEGLNVTGGVDVFALQALTGTLDDSDNKVIYDVFRASADGSYTSIMSKLSESTDTVDLFSRNLTVGGLSDAKMNVDIGKEFDPADNNTVASTVDNISIRAQNNIKISSRNGTITYGNDTSFSTLFQPAYGCYYLKTPTISFLNYTFNPFDSDIASVETTVNPVGVAMDDRGEISVAADGVYEITLVGIIEGQSSGGITVLQRYRLYKGGTTRKSGDPSQITATTDVLGINSTPAIHTAVDPVERTLKSITNLTTASKVGIGALCGTEGNAAILFKEGTTITIKRIA